VHALFGVGLFLQELRARGVAEQHIGAALAGVFGDSKMLQEEALSQEAEGEPGLNIEGARCCAMVLQGLSRLAAS